MMNKLDISEWKAFNISDLFITEPNKNKLQVPTGSAIARKDLEDGDVPRITVTGINNGIVGYYKNIDSSDYRVFENFISVSFLGTIFYHSYRASLDMKVHCLKLKNKELNSHTALFLISIIKKQMRYFAYNDQLSSTVLPQLSLSLPVKDNEPDWEYMESYIHNLYILERENISIVADYVTKPTAKSVDMAKWGTFAISELFNNIQQGKRLKKHDQIDGDIPFVMAGRTNTGVANRISNPIVMFPKNAITIDIFGNTFYREYEFSAGDDTGVYWNTINNYSKNVMIFLTTIIQKTIQKNYDFSDKLRSSKSLDIEIFLPITSDNKPDWQYMEDYIGNIFSKTNNNYIKLKII
ncbi:restriction endonuclease subunit S [Pasteurella testudinis]|uniref:restriction endonuclease subunit S n=1 Tax=Pasteurella testudinis TaxID=761 RepID=UPI0040595D2F